VEWHRWSGNSLLHLSPFLHFASTRANPIPSLSKADKQLNFNLEDIHAVNETVEVEFTKSELEGLLGSISGEANHAKVRKLALELDDIATMFERCLHPSCFITTFGLI
jgi:hypothetical protein